MIDRSEENTESSIELVYADDGYSNEKDLNKLEERNIEGYVATRKTKNSESKKKISDKKIKCNTSSQGGICHKTTTNAKPTTKNSKTYKNPATERMRKEVNHSTWESQIQRKGLDSKKHLLPELIGLKNVQINETWFA